MATESPLRFPSPSELLGDNAPAARAPTLDPSPRKGPGDGKKHTKHARRPSRESKRKDAAPRKAAAVEGKDASVVKPKQTKSRNGCATCKAKRLKCGEEKPHCTNCTRKGLQCGGYKKTFQWRDFNQTGAKANINQFTFTQVHVQPERPKTSSSTSPARASAESSKTNTPASENPPNIPGAPIFHVTSANTKANNERKRTSDEIHALLRTSRSTSPKNDGPEPRDSVFAVPPEDSPDPGPPPPHDGTRDFSGSDEFASVHFDPQSAFAYRSRSLSPHNTRGIPSPTLTELLGHPSSPNGGPGPQDFVSFSMPDDLHLPLMTAGGDESGMFDDGHGDEQLDFMNRFERMEEPSFVWPSRWPSRNNTPVRRQRQSSIINPSLAALWGAPIPSIFAELNFPVDSEQALVYRFDKLTCGILSIADGPNENPWRSIIWPMAQQSPALYEAILAMTAFHSHVEEPTLRVVGHQHKMNSIRYIQEGIRDASMDDMTAIATALALGFSESWEDLTSTGNTHIKGAQALVKRVLEEHQMNPRRGDDLRRLKFLCNAWVYMDVIARLTSVDSDESNDFDNTFLFSNDPSRLIMGRGHDRNRGFGIDFGMDIDARLDPLMGCAGTLFPLIGRVANLVRKVCRSQHNSPGIVSHGRDLKMMVEEWDPPEEVEDPEDPTTGIQHAIETAEAYRWATLLHLHQAVPELPSLTAAEISQKCMASIATVPVDSRTVIVQIYPLMVAGCEAVEAEDRQWIRERWMLMKHRMRIGVIDKCMSVCEEVWRRKDDYEARPINQRKLVSTRDLNAARQRRSTLEPKIPPNQRRPFDSRDTNPGRTGVVFSFVDSDSEPKGQNLRDMSGLDSARIRRRDLSDLVKTDPAYTVRGHCHWVGVMWDWGWEVFLG
ncbi:hypothetical protein DOTSEDRAFT_67777 [Dothistroma septosporum NZE10]|uniref:Zn(2)-C6 fungal-type domain-containing protein n=1 Tax=Dothistroma septosporum (strain NZE10 / CBS 128990) TaxID=675120 RepID=N1PZ74_DOTSN|nr:hypothetical protein DOTSEDRAFT_67777 [Dothistroma septosporum NZE10]